MPKLAALRFAQGGELMRPRAEVCERLALADSRPLVQPGYMTVFILRLH